jgi:hypothetical protein
MIRSLHALTLFLASTLACTAETWPLDAVDAPIKVVGEAKVASGAHGEALVLDGVSVIELKDSAALNGGEGFTFSVWFNPYALSAGQQVIAGKNRYSLNERQWSLTVEPDGRLKAYVQQGGWATITSEEALQAGHWHLATLTVSAGKAALFLNGKAAGEVVLKKPVPATQAPITLGGIVDAGVLQQTFSGAVDEARFEPRVLSAEEVAASYKPVTATHELPKPLESDTPVWDERVRLLKAAELPVLEGVEFHVIKKQAPDTDGAKWTLGVGLAWHKGRLYASYGFNKGDENTPTEEAHVRVSDDGGKTWGAPVVMDHGEGNLGVSHGVFLSHGGNLWAFMGAFYDHFQRTHTRAYLLDETTGQWQAKGTVLNDGFWPMQEPQKMDDGNWIMSGARVAKGYDFSGDPPAVAISHGDDFTKWDLVVLPLDRRLRSVWGESTVIVKGRHITNISRYGGKALALIATSDDFGRTWSTPLPSNLPMATSKPYAGTLSTGQRYLVCTTTADTGGRRSPLTIAVSKPGESVFSKVFVIRRSIFPEGPGVSSERADFSYPYAIEHDGKLYVGYTNKSHAANELAVIPVASLSVAAEASPVATLESRGLPRILFNNDSDDLKWPAYPEHHADGLWVPAGEYLPLPTIHSLADALAPRIGPLAKTKTQGLSYCGNFGLPIWELKRDHIAALGDDPLQPILQFWKRDGRTFFFSMRMNDIHHAWFNWAHLWSDFHRSQRHLFLKPPTDKEWEAEFLPWFEGKTSKRPAISTSSVAFDYSRAEVRTYYLETLREACRRYDQDGVELDWLRYPDLFREGEVNVAIMTAFVRDARAVLDEAGKRRGHPLRLLARVPVTPEQALSVGLDVEAWLKAGWLDAVIAGPGTSFSSCPLERWVDLAHRHGVPVYGSMERQNRNNVPRYGSPETLRAAIATLWEKGADGLYFFNFYIRDEMPLLDEFADRALLARLPKEYFLESGGDKDLTKSGGPLPLALKPGNPATVHLVIADDPAKAKEASLEILFKSEGETEAPTITLNGQPLKELKSTSAKAGFTLTLSSAALKSALKRGTNDFTFTSAASVTVTSLSVGVMP